MANTYAPNVREWYHTRSPGENILGAFSHSAGTAPIIMLFILGTPLKTTHLQKHAQSIQNSMECRVQDPGTRGKHQTKKKKSLVYQQGL